MRFELRIYDGGAKQSSIQVRVGADAVPGDCYGCILASVVAQAIHRLGYGPTSARSFAECIVDHMHTALDARERGKR